MIKPKPKNNIEIKKMRSAGRLAAEVLDFMTGHVKEGVDTEKLDKLCHDFICDHNAVPAPLNYRGFPKSICTSINDVVCHGIPSTKDILKDGDILNIDITVILDSYHGDTSRMFLVADVSEKAKKLVNDTYDAMMKGIATIKSGSKLHQIGKTIQADAGAKGYGIVKDYCGHGLGKVFHEAPMVLHYYPQPSGTDLKLRKGLTFTVEPMINLGTHKCETMDDEWTVKTMDRKLSAQFEHSLVVTEDGVEILTESPKGLHKPPYK